MPSLQTIVVRAIYLIVALVALLFGFSQYKKIQRHSALVSELRLLTSDSSYFQQFYPADARKTLVRAIGLIAEAKNLGRDPHETIDRALGLRKPMFDDRDPKENASRKTLLVLDSLRDNYAHAAKLGFVDDHKSVTTMKSGELPPILSGPQAGSRAAIVPIIDPALSPGLDKVVANLAIRPPGAADATTDDVQTAAAKQLAGRLAAAGVIEQEVADAIILSLPSPAEQP